MVVVILVVVVVVNTMLRGGGEVLLYSVDIGCSLMDMSLTLQSIFSCCSEKACDSTVVYITTQPIRMILFMFGDDILIRL